VKTSDFINGEKVVLTDGSMGTYLEQLGYRGQIPDLAVLDAPELVKRVHREYVEAGAQVILTDTFGANRLRLSMKGLQDKIESINSTAVQAAAEVRDSYGNVLVAGDMGSTGEMLEPYGNLTVKEAEKIFAEQAEMLRKSGADFLLLETFQDIEELKIAFYAAKETDDIFVLPSITLNAGVEYRTLMGQRIEDVVKFVEESGAGVMGVNCGIKSREMIKAVREIRKVTGTALWVKPNAGLPEVSGGVAVYPETVEEFTDNCVEIAGHGVNFIGGCCGTTPEYIAVLKKKLNENS
jgi:5-methyltetrahydrofolate--homocysteine methyltransferase